MEASPYGGDAYDIIICLGFVLFKDPSGVWFDVKCILPRPGEPEVSDDQAVSGP